MPTSRLTPRPPSPTQGSTAPKQRRFRAIAATLGLLSLLSLLAMTGCGTQHALLQVVDTRSSLGPLETTPEPITMADLIRYHGHRCDGLVVAAVGVSYGLGALFPKGPVDRTDVAIAVNGSVCYGDVSAYLTGARARYQTLVVDKKLHDRWILLRRSTGEVMEVRLKRGIKPAGLPGQERRLRASGCDVQQINAVQQTQDRFAAKVLKLGGPRAFELRRLPRFPYAIGPRRGDTTKRACGEDPRPPPH